jgi:hypothetical protein
MIPAAPLVGAVTDAATGGVLLVHGQRPGAHPIDHGERIVRTLARAEFAMEPRGTPRDL